MHIIVWNGFAGRLQVYRGTEESVRDQAELYLNEDTDVIYFYGEIDAIILKESKTL